MTVACRGARNPLGVGLAGRYIARKKTDGRGQGV